MSSQRVFTLMSSVGVFAPETSDAVVSPVGGRAAAGGSAAGGSAAGGSAAAGGLAGCAAAAGCVACPYAVPPAPESVSADAVTMHRLIANLLMLTSRNALWGWHPLISRGNDIMRLLSQSSCFRGSFRVWLELAAPKTELSSLVPSETSRWDTSTVTGAVPAPSGTAPWVCLDC